MASSHANSKSIEKMKYLGRYYCILVSEFFIGIVDEALKIYSLNLLFIKRATVSIKIRLPEWILFNLLKFLCNIIFSSQESEAERNF